MNGSADGFLGFIDAAAAGGPDAVKAHLTKAMLDFLENSGQLASFCNQGTLSKQKNSANSLTEAQPKSYLTTASRTGVNDTSSMWCAATKPVCYVSWATSKTIS